MQISTRSRTLIGLAAALAFAATGAQAADAEFSGHIIFNTDVVEIAFELAADATDVKLWTDSWQSGVNFDPIGALWVRTGNDYTLLAEVDDDDSIAPTQGYFDTGFALPTLNAGSYLYTVAASPNGALGPKLSNGFSFTGSTPIRLSDWEQPGNDPNTHDQKGGYWHVGLSGIDSAAVVPEPSTWALMALGLGWLGWAASKTRGRRYL